MNKYRGLNKNLDRVLNTLGSRQKWHSYQAINMPYFSDDEKLENLCWIFHNSDDFSWYILKLCYVLKILSEIKIKYY